MDPHKQFRIILYKWLRFIGALMGHDILKRNFKINIHALIIFSSLIFVSNLYLWTIYISDLNTALRTGGVLGVALQITSKSFFTLLYRKELKQSVLSLELIYQQSTTNRENIITLARFSRQLKICVRIIFTNFTLCALVFITAPGLIYLLNGSVLMILPSLVPGVDPTTVTGYTINMIYDATMVSLAAGQYIYSDGLLTVQVLHVILMTNILKNRIRDVNEMVSPPRASEQDVRVHFRNILILHNEMISFVNNLGTLYYFPIVCTVLCTMMDIAVNIFGTFVLHPRYLLSVYFMIMAELVQLFYYCLVGTIVDVSFDRFYEEIITSKWYALPQDCQKNLVVMLTMANRPNNFNIGDVLPLNMDTFVDLVKKIYSFSMVLYSFY